MKSTITRLLNTSLPVATQTVINTRINQFVTDRHDPEDLVLPENKPTIRWKDEFTEGQAPLTQVASWFNDKLFVFVEEPKNSRHSSGSVV